MHVSFGAPILPLTQVAGWLSGNTCLSGEVPQGDKGAAVTSATQGQPGWTVQALCMASADRYTTVEGGFSDGVRFDITSSPFNKVVASPSQCGLECTKTTGCL